MIQNNVTYSKLGLNEYTHININHEYEICICIGRGIIELCTKKLDAGNLVMSYEKNKFTRLWENHRHVNQPPQNIINTYLWIVMAERMKGKA